MAATISISYYSSWYIFSGTNPTSWTQTYLYAVQWESPSLILIVINFIILITGLTLFLIGFITFLKEKQKKKNFIIKTGIYKILRHPQNLGIIIFFLSFAIYFQIFRDIGIRLGDLLSWGLFTMLISLESLYEEWVLYKTYNTQFLEYLDETSKFYGKLLLKSKNEENPYNIKRYFIGKMIIIPLIFALYVLIWYILYKLLNEYFILFRVPPYLPFGYTVPE